MRISTLLVDDEPLALSRMRAMLQADPELEIVGECGDGLGAVEAIQRLRPDLLFLDIQMPELDGFEVLSLLGPEALPVTIFVTAYDQFALQAFRARAVDYLLKPFSREELEQSLRRGKEVLRGRMASGDLGALLTDAADRTQRCERFVIRREDRVLVMQAEDVEAIEAEANYMWLHRSQEAHPIRGTLAALEQRLEPGLFHRCHRSWILNVRHLKALLLEDPHGPTAVMASGLRVPVSFRHRKGVEELLDR